MLEWNRIYNMDCFDGLRMIDDESINCVITSPPYYRLRNYEVKGQIGLEDTPEEYIQKIVFVFHEINRILRDDGTLWLNLGDTYDRKTKNLLGIPWKVAFELQADGWHLRQDIIWSKPNPMPESVIDRCTKSHEYLFLLTKSAKYYFDHGAMLEEATGYDGRQDTKYKGGKKDISVGAHERWRYKNLQSDGQRPNTMHFKRLVGEEYLSPVRNRRSVWTVATEPFREAHFATYPEKLIEPCILAGCPKDGVVLDPFMGAGTTAIVADRFNRSYIGFEINPEYIKIAEKRIAKNQPRLNELS